MNAPISVLVVEDHALFRTGIRVGCNRDQSISVAGEAANGSEAVAQAMKLNPDVVLMDVSMPLMDGIESTRLIKELNRNTKVIMLTSHDSDGVVHSALSAGASGYCLKDVASDVLCSAIKAVHRGEVWLDPIVAKKVDQICMQSARDRFEYVTHLNQQEKSVLEGFSTVPPAAQPCEISQGNTRTLAVSILNKAGRVAELNKRTAYDTGMRVSNTLSEKYESLGLIGQGGMSLVYKAKHRMLDRIVAVKVLVDHLSHLDTFSARFMQEARITSQLSHENIAAVHDFGITQEGNAFLVMEYVDGPSLADVLHRVGRLQELEALKIFKQLKDALHYAHTQGVVHRDIKPANLILLNGSNGPIVKLVDFGLAKAASIENPKLTLNGEVIGSPIYMSPEQCQGLDVDHRSDIYSLGCLMYEVICGYPPFRGETALDTFRMHVQDDYVDPPAHLCSEQLRDVLRKCLKKNPDERYSSLCELAV